MRRIEITQSTEVPLGLIDTLSSGFRVVQRRPWLILLPLLLDLWLWLGPRWSIQPLVDSLLAWWQPANLPTELASTAETYRESAGDRRQLQPVVAGGQQPHLAAHCLAQPDRSSASGRSAGRRRHPAAGVAVVDAAAAGVGCGAGQSLLAHAGQSVAALRANNATDAASEPAAPDASARQQAGIGFWLGRGLRTFMLTALLGLILLALLLAASLLLSLVMTPVLLIAPQAGAVVVSITTLLLSGWRW